MHAGPLRVLHQGHQGTHLIDRKPELAAAADERQPLHIGVAIDALAAGLPVRRAQQSNLFVIADGGRIGAGPLREGSDLQARHGADPLSVFWLLNLK